jgi:hypothetical protein
LANIKESLFSDLSSYDRTGKSSGFKMFPGDPETFYSNSTPPVKEYTVLHIKLRQQNISSEAKKDGRNMSGRCFHKTITVSTQLQRKIIDWSRWTSDK